METVSGVVQKFSCSICGNSYPIKERLIEHLEEHEKGKQKCQQCFQEFSNKHYLRVHLISVHDVDLTSNATIPKSVSNVPYVPGKFRCGECGNLYSTITSLLCHSKLHIEGRHKCPHCPKDFSIKNYLITHLVIAHKVPVDSKRLARLVCRLCNRQFAQKDHLLYHLKRKHFGFAVKELKKKLQHQCYFCHSKFWSSADLKNHIRQHTQEMPFQCYVCAQTFSTKRDLIAHKKTRQNQ